MPVAVRWQRCARAGATGDLLYPMPRRKITRQERKTAGQVRDLPCGDLRLAAYATLGPRAPTQNTVYLYIIRRPRSAVVLVPVVRCRTPLLLRLTRL